MTSVPCLNPQNSRFRYKCEKRLISTGVKHCIRVQGRPIFLANVSNSIFWEVFRARAKKVCQNDKKFDESPFFTDSSYLIGCCTRFNIPDECKPVCVFLDAFCAIGDSRIHGPAALGDFCRYARVLVECLPVISISIELNVSSLSGLTAYLLDPLGD